MGITAWARHPCTHTSVEAHTFTQTHVHWKAGQGKPHRKETSCRQADGRTSCLGSWWERERP